MVIFTTPEFYPILYRLRKNGSLPSYFILDYKTPLEMPPIASLVSTFEQQHQTDPERQSNYLSWLENLFSFCQSPMVIFTTPEFYPILYRLRKNGSLPSYFILDYKTPLEMPPIASLVSTFEQQHQTDPERAYHSVDLYAVWCAKSFMLNRTVELNPFHTVFFLYMDAGAFRLPKYRFQAWPDVSTLSNILNTNRFLLGMIARLPNRFCSSKYQITDGPIKIDLIEGTFMGGSIDTVRWWTSAYYEIINDYRVRKFFIGKDQYIMNTIALVYSTRINVLLPFRISCDNVWFAFGPLFASKPERKNLSFSHDCQEQKLSEIVIPFDKICANIENIS
ncbi:unnamed protein product [Adineta ricciae]|uniref:Uncharacterized protein n=1 Tax=Adineta ricciae TaxID=249248 RepID=A0A814KCP6_ADIRI|nr:unnamed protein product [Adineta ricciae]